MDKFITFVLVGLGGMLIGVLSIVGVVMLNMDTVPEGKTWVLYEYDGYRSGPPKNTATLKVWPAGDRIYFEEHYSSRHLPPITPPSGN